MIKIEREKVIRESKTMTYLSRLAKAVRAAGVSSGRPAAVAEQLAAAARSRVRSYWSQLLVGSR